MLQRPTDIAVRQSPLPPGKICSQATPAQQPQTCADTSDELTRAMAIGGAHERSPGLITEAFPTALRTRLEALGFSFHTLADSDGNRRASPEHVGKHWWCWCGPEGRWSVETGESVDDDCAALLDALDFYTTYVKGMREAILERAPDDEPTAEADDDIAELAWYEAARIVREGV